MLILYTSTRCPKCSNARKIVREVAKEIGWIEGKQFVEKLIDGKDLHPGTIVLEGQKYTLVNYQEQITPENSPAAVVGEDVALEALMHQIASTPSIIINGIPRFVSIIPTREELLKALGR